MYLAVRWFRLHDFHLSLQNVDKMSHIDQRMRYAHADKNELFLGRGLDSPRKCEANPHRDYMEVRIVLSGQPTGSKTWSIL